MSRMHHGMSRYDHLVKACLDHKALNDASVVLPQFFGRLGPENPLVWSRPKTELVGVFERLVDTMLRDDLVEGPADAGMTFFGQFVDHDVTLDATSTIGSVINPATIRNIRTPNLDLDCVYGDGPDASPHLYGRIGGRDGFLLFGRSDSPLDLVRNCKGTALIGDPRNDENIFISQIQGAYICLHNLLLHEVHEGTALGHEVKDIAMQGTSADLWSGQAAPPATEFEVVRRFIRLHYQFHILHDMLPAFVTQSAIDTAMAGDPFGPRAALMPVEFSGAAYRFGHATAQQSYRFKPGGPVKTLFEIRGFGPRGPDSDIALGDFFGPGAQKARPVGTTVARDLFLLPFVGAGFTMPDGTAVSVDQARKLPLRNILRDRFALQIANGQKLAGMLGVDPLAAPPILAAEHITRTPLWFYCLQEAQEKGNGRLTGVGGCIVASVLVRLLKCDPESVWHVPGFGAHATFATLASTFAWVEAHRDGLPGKAELYCPN